MSQLDEHVRQVRVRLGLARLIHWLAWSLTILGGVWLLIVVLRLTSFVLPREEVWFFALLGVAIAAPIAVVMGRRPTRHEAAIAIDEKLQLKEKFSTALFLRSSSDPFAAAAVRDAEQTASKVSLSSQFRPEFPRTGFITLGVAAVVILAQLFMPMADVFNIARHKEAARQAHAADVAQVHRELKQADAEFLALPPAVADLPEIKARHEELADLSRADEIDPTQGHKLAQKLLDQIAAAKQKIVEEKNFALAKNNQLSKTRDTGATADQEVGPIANADHKFADGNVQDAAEEIQKIADNFDKMDQKEQEKIADEMQKLAEKMQQQANDPAVKKEIENKLRQAGMPQQQAQQMADKMQAAANGDQSAARDLQNMANQAIQNMNQQAGKSSQQQQQSAQAIQNAVQNALSQANTQANAQAMNQAMNQLAGAMKQQAAAANKGQQSAQAQAAQQQMKQAMSQLQAQASGAAGIAAGQQQMGLQQASAGPQSQGAPQQPGAQQGQQASAAGQQGQSGQQAQQGQPAGGQKVGGQQAGGQQAGGQPGGQQAGGQQGQSASAAGKQGGSQQGQSAGQQGQGSPSASAGGQNGSGSQQVQAGGQSAQGGGQPGSGQQGPGSPSASAGAGQGSQPGNGQQGPGSWGQAGQGEQGGNPQQQGQGGGGGGGIAAGGRRPDPVAAPFMIKKELSASATLDNGKILARSFVNAPSEKGESHVQFGKVIESAKQELDDPLEQDRIPRSKQGAVKSYFDTLNENRDVHGQ